MADFYGRVAIHGQLYVATRHDDPVFESLLYIAYLGRRPQSKLEDSPVGSDALGVVVGVLVEQAYEIPAVDRAKTQPTRLRIVWMGGCNSHAISDHEC